MKPTIEGLFETILISCVLIFAGFIIVLMATLAYKELFPNKPITSLQCRDGTLFDVVHEGNITIYEKRPFTTCEER